MGHNFDNKIIEAYLYSRESIITEVNDEFIDLTGFTRGELLGKSLIEIGTMIRINTQIFLENINTNYSGYVFTKSLSVRDVNISLFHGKEANEKTYTFVEKPNSRLDDKLIFMEQTLSDNIVGVSVYSVPDLIMVKVNQKYLDFHDSPYNEEETSIGLSIREIVTGYVGTQSEVITNTVIETRKSSYLKEIKFERFERGITYWDSTRTPIFENGIMKYIMFTTSESTERVLKNESIEGQNKIIEKQKEQLEQQKYELEQKNIQLNSILENLTEGVMVTDNKGKYIMMNPEAKRLIFQSDKVIDSGDTFKNSRYFDLKGNELSFEDLPGIRALRGEKFKDIRMSIKFPHKTLQVAVSGTPIYDSEGKFTLGVICHQDMTDYFKHEEAIRSRYEFMDKMIDTFDLPVIRFSCPDLTIIDINQKAFSTLKLLLPDIKSIRELKGNKFEDLFNTFKQKNEYYRCINEVIKEKKTKYLNKSAQVINKNEVYWNVIFEPIIEANEEIVEILILIIDVTSEIKSNIGMEKILKLQEEFFANISHELKTPLNVISATVQLLKMYYSDESLYEKKDSAIKYIDSMKQKLLSVI
ncbi:MAG TPA: PAS domain-containing protein [Ruminiclostridium sp.]